MSGGQADEKLLVKGIIQMLNADGWYEVRCVGDHHQFKHHMKPGLVTVTHPEKNIPIKTVKSIERQAGIKFP